MARRKRDQIEPVDGIKMRGSLEYVLRNAATGEVVRSGKTTNAVLFKGRSWVLQRMGTNSDSNYIQALLIGKSSGNNDSSQTTMQNYTTLKTIGTTAITTASNSTPSMSWAVSFTTNETWTDSSQIGEFGLWNSSNTNSGTLLARAITNPYINFGSTNTLAITYTISN